MTAIERLGSQLSSQGYSHNYGTEDGIPYLEVWTKGGTLMAPSHAAELACQVHAAFQCPVHFHRLEGTSMSFFVYEPTRTYSAGQLEEYGTPVDQWLNMLELDLRRSLLERG